MSEFLPEIRRARFDKLTIYEVSHSELEVLEKGSPDSLFLNLAIALLSIAISFTVSLVTTKIDRPHTFVVFVVCTVVGYVAGVVLLLAGLRNRRTIAECVVTIRSRLPPEGKRLDPGVIPEVAATTDTD